ncbi:DUF5686 family protein [uncultured Hymenobacter sp.]|uniref:DUF5686 and carboxypeptidase-like regulatory domain-containing protein n=1 Tax=uncultured Hymenobacter sp. TaxID=170016 RepID=UPI0035CB581E
MKILTLLLLLALLGAQPALAQRLVISGQVVEAASGEPVPFASVFVPGTSSGATANLGGRFRLVLALSGPTPDSIAASALGFATQRRKLAIDTSATTQTVLFRLRPGGVALAEVVVLSRQPENPAFRILREVQRHRPQNDRATLQAAEFDSYNRTEVALANLPARLAKRKAVQDMRALAVRRGAAAAADPDAPLPIFASEVGSRMYQKYSPLRRREDIQHRQMRGLGPREGSVLSQLLGSNIQNFDFYPNWQNILSKDFISPIAEGGRLTYDYELVDSVNVDKDWCYQIAVKPKRSHDLAFRGTIWITAGTYALRRVDLVANANANINFITDLRIFQDLTPPDQGPGLPTRTRLVFGVQPYQGQAAMRVRLTTINSNFARNVAHEAGFYDVPVNVAGQVSDPLSAPSGPGDDALTSALTGQGPTGPGYFDQHRPDTLSLSEQQTFAVLDSAKQLPSVRNVLDYVELFVNGYKRVGKLELGPILNTYAYNDFEGHRFRLGFRTTPDISKRTVTQGYLAYGTRDGRFKYGLKTSRIVERRHWTVLSLEYRHDVEQIALLDNDFLSDNNLFVAASRWGRFRQGRPVLRDLTAVSAQRDLFHGFTQTLTLRHQHFNPQHDFAYYPGGEPRPAPGPGPTPPGLGREFNLAEVVLESRYARDENLVQSENRRRAIGLKKWPVLTLRYTIGLNRVLGADFGYHKLNLLLTHSVATGQLGRLSYRLEGNYIPTPVPYPVLKTPLGNQTPFLNQNSFNLMRYFEFVTDRSVSVRVEQHFEGLLLNSLPLVRRLNWRLVGSANLLYGDLSGANRRLLPPTDQAGRPLTRLNSLGRLPYAEVSYGVENIFKVVRLDFLHRVTYRHLPGANNFGIKAGFQFRL